MGRFGTSGGTCQEERIRTRKTSYEPQIYRLLWVAMGRFIDINCSIMGNTANGRGQEDTASEMVKKKTELQFKQTDFIRQIEGSIEQEYELLSPCLENNQFYELRKAIHRKTTLTRAVYIVNKYKIRSNEREMFERQIHQLKRIDHPAAPKIYELFKNDHRFFVVTEHRQGESLAVVLERQHYFEEKWAASIVWQLLAMLNYCHTRGIHHTDLKLTAISFNSKMQEMIRVEDLCISKIFRIDEVIQQSLGRAVITAPQAISGACDSKADIWSCGVILYLLLCGQPPIMASSKQRLIHKYKNFFLRFKERRFKHVSEEGKEMIRRMLKINPNQRPSADELMESPWFTKYMRLPRLPDNTMRRCLRELYFFNPTSKLQEATWSFFVNALISFDEKRLIMAIFLRLDRSSHGELEEEDLQEGFAEIMEREEARECAVEVMGRIHKKRILFSQFLSYCANRFFLIKEANLSKIFNIFDEDGSGEIEISEIRDTLGNSKELGEDVWAELMKEADANSDGKISFEEFGELMGSLNDCGQLPHAHLFGED